MIACPDCNTFNPDGESACLSCEAPLTPLRPTGARPAGRGSTAVQGRTRCSNGHPIDPRWSSCPYCTNGGAIDRTTRLEPASAERQKTRLEMPPERSGPPRTTVLRPSGDSAPPGTEPAPQLPARPRAVEAAPGPAQDTRPLVGVLAAPDATPGGLVFSLREGKNRIGGQPGCEIRLSHDPQVSGDHALILHRGGSFYLNDRMSTNGTFLNDQEVDPAANATALADRDRIRCGGTELVLLVLDRAAGPS